MRPISSLLAALLLSCTAHEPERGPDLQREEPPPAAAVVWTRVSTPAELRAAVQAASPARPIVLAFHAAWSMPCVELERRTFVDPAVVSELRRYTTIVLDVTDDPGGPLQRMFVAESLPSVLLYAGGSGLAAALAEPRASEVVLLPPASRVAQFVGPDQLVPLLAAVR